jgi:hypothetical protein
LPKGPAFHIQTPPASLANAVVGYFSGDGTGEIFIAIAQSASSPSNRNKMTRIRTFGVALS